MTLVDRVRAKREQELEAIASRYDNIRQAYGDLLAKNAASPTVGWCRTRIAEGIPEWLVASALMNAHLNLAGERLRPAVLQELVRRQKALALQDSNVRPLLDTSRAWEMGAKLLEASLDMSSLSVLQRYGARGRVGKGYPSGAFLRVLRAVGLDALDVPHAPVIPPQIEQE